MVDKRLRFIIGFGIEALFVGLSVFGIVYGLIGGVPFNVLLIVGSVLTLSISLGYVHFDYISLKRELKVPYNSTVLYQKTSEYYLIPPRKHLSSINEHNKNPYAVTKDAPNPIFTHCYFHAQYYDIQKSQLANFQCNENVLESGYCAYHDNHYINGREFVLGNALNDKINKMVDDEQEIFCIGYRIPFVSLTGKNIKKPIHFHDATIRIADFMGSVFEYKATAYFVKTEFEEAPFENATYHGHVLFNKAQVSRISQRQKFFSRLEKHFGLLSGRPCCIIYIH